MQVLLICMDQDEKAILSRALERTSLRFLTASGLDHALRNWGESPSDLILFADSSSDPINAIQQLRSITTVPLILLTDPVREEDHVNLLNTGADLVFFRPYSTRLLVTQVPALLRRMSGLPLVTLPTLRQRDICVEPTTRKVEVVGLPPRQLSHLEFRLLYTLMVESGRVLATDDLVERVWGYTGEGDRDLVRKLVHRLRLKVEPDPNQPRYILSVPGTGYTYSENEASYIQDPQPADNP